MKQEHNYKVEGLDMTFGTGTLAGLAAGAVTVTVGETSLLVAATMAATIREGQDWFPLTVDYRERFAAAGRFPGGYFKREGRPSEKEILTCRLTDRPCRPLFPKGFLNEVQIAGLLLTADLVNDSDISMVNGASAALAISDIPWNGPIACVRVARIEGEFVANPTIDQQFSSDLDLIYVGNTTDMLMIEGSADQLPEDDFIKALEFAHESIQPIIATINTMVEEVGKEKRVPTLVVCDEKVLEIVKEAAGDAIAASAKLGSKQARMDGLAAAGEKAVEALNAQLGEGGYNPNHLKMGLEELQEEAYRTAILNDGYRSGGRPTDALREITCDTRRSAPGSRFSSLPARRDPGPGHRHPGIDRRLPEPRRPDRWPEGQVLHPALQLPALLGRRDRPHDGSGSSRDRAWCPGRAFPAPGRSDRGDLPLLHQAQLRDHVLQRLDLDGFDLRRHPGAHGCRRPHRGSGRRYLDRPGPRGR